MRNIILLCMALAMGACANAPRLSTDQQFEAYRMQLRGERDTGKITVVEEQEKLRDHFWQVYGKDSNSIGHFAFSVSLMRSVQAGSFPLEDADALIAAKEADIFATKIASRQRDCTYDCPWH